jgi:hypothetical protein
MGLATGEGHPMKLRTAFAAMAAVGALLGSIPAQAADPGDGTWVLNVAKSKYEPGPAPKSETREYQTTADGTKLSIHIVNADGSTQDEAAVYKLDGKSYPLSGNANIDAIRVRRINARETRSTEMRNGQVIGHLTRRVSGDGKTLNITVTVKTTTGQTIHSVRLYDRQ